VSYITFSNALSIDCTAGNPADIDVREDALFFDADPVESTVPGATGIGFTAQLGTNSLALSDADDILSNVDMTVSNPNGWAAFDQTGGSITWNGGDLTITGNDATDSFGTPSGLDPEQDVEVTVPSDNTVGIADGAVTVTYAGAANTGFTTDSSTGSCALASLEKNGSSDRLTFLLTPGSAFSNYIRITNPSSTNGKVRLTLITDAGQSVSFDIDAIEGVNNAVLPAGNSTGLITIDQLYAAAQATDATFDAAGGKLRLEANAEFGNNKEITGGGGEVDNNGGGTIDAVTYDDGSTGVNLQAFSRSKDANAFFMMQKD
jgi:hypothetical protein